MMTPTPSTPLPTPRSSLPKQITQRTVIRIIDRAKRSDLGLNDPVRTPEIGKYAQHNLQTLGLLLFDCWEAKYDLCALMTAAIEEIAEHATANVAADLATARSEASLATAALARSEERVKEVEAALREASSLLAFLDGAFRQQMHRVDRDRMTAAHKANRKALSHD